MPRSDNYLKTLKRALGDFTGEQAELWLEDKTADVTKFNEGGIFQNISEKGVTVRARVLKKGRLGTALVQGETTEAVRRALELAAEMAPYGQEAPADYAFPKSEAPLDLPCFDEKTRNYTPIQRARDLKHAVAKASEPGMDFSGSLKIDLIGQYVVNTSGLANQAETSQANINYISLLNDAQSHAGAAATSIDDLDLTGLAGEAAATCVKSQNPKDCEPGEYTLVLPPNALADLTPFFGMLIFSGLADLEGRCCLSGRIGEKAASDLVDLTDDATDQTGICRPLDNEGVAKRPLELMKKGVPLAFVHDSLSAARAGAKNTGHAFPATPAVYGPSTANLVMQPGNASLEGIIKGVEKGILATRLHYVRCLNDKEALVGGVTSNGTFLIKDGRIVYPVKPMRFTTRLVDGMLKNISAVTSKRLTMIRTAQGPTSVSLYSSAHTLPGVRSDAWQLRKTD